MAAQTLSFIYVPLPRLLLSFFKITQFKMKTTRPIFPTPASPFKTSRLLIRPMTMDDLADLHILRTQYDVMKWTSTTKVDVDHAFTTTWLERYLPPNDSRTSIFVIEELSNPGRVIGAIGSHVAEPPECGYMLRTEYWGKGYATEALRGWLQIYWELPRREVDVDDKIDDLERHVDDAGVLREVLRAEIAADNVPSGNVLEKCGFVRGGSEEIEENGGVVKLVHFYLEKPVI